MRVFSVRRSGRACMRERACARACVCVRESVCESVCVCLCVYMCARVCNGVMGEETVMNECEVDRRRRDENHSKRTHHIS